MDWNQPQAIVAGLVAVSTGINYLVGLKIKVDISERVDAKVDALKTWISENYLSDKDMKHINFRLERLEERPSSKPNGKYHAGTN